MDHQYAIVNRRKSRKQAENEKNQYSTVTHNSEESYTYISMNYIKKFVLLGSNPNAII